MYTFTNSFNKNHSKEGIPMNVFDILGPVMIGPSSSHTAGAARIGRITRTLLGAPAVKADILQAPELAKAAGLKVHISTGDIDGAHPNTARVTLTDANGRQVSLLGSSIGGGNILVTEVNGMEVSLTGQYTTLIVLHKDTPGIIAAVTEVMAEEGINICNFRLSRQKKGGEAVMTIELDGMPSPEINKKINTLPNIYSSTMLQPI